MSIGYFPKLYEEELLYSVFCRFYQHGGYLSFKDAARELFLNPKIRVEKEFVKNLKPEIVELLTQDMAFDELLEKHTMYPFYGRFIKPEKRKRAYKVLLAMEGEQVKNDKADFSKIFGMPQLKKGEQRFIRYCPKCAMEDREQYGETYWHRLPQMRNINLCARHGCYLLNSAVSLDSRMSVKLVSAEEVVPANDFLMKQIKYCKLPLELKLAKYMEDVFHMPIETSGPTNSSVGNFLRLRMMGTPYISSRGEHNYYHRLWEDMQLFYNGISDVKNITDGQMQRTLKGNREIFSEICAIAMFLNISAKELADMEVSHQLPQQIFDDKVQQLWKSGMGINAISRELGVASSMVRMSINHSPKDGSEIGQKYKNCGKRINWDIMDKNTLPLVKKAILELKGDSTTRPHKISMYAVGKKINISVARLQNMESCKREIMESRDCKEEYGARKILWAVNKLQAEESLVMFWKLAYLTKLEKEEMMQSIPYLEQMDSDAAQQVKNVLSDILV